ncbi:PAS domain-containing protein [Yoonia sp. 208BN28-4]|uniref:PAS domain-containing protein n=1 Tax=Yoonia sp. 208BN28-4 TaxID=3126505 RepID=UPI0030A1A0A0
MSINQKLKLGSLAGTLEGLPFALSLSDLTLPDQPLIFMNAQFRDMTGYGEEQLGQNCRFLQGDLENTEARAEIRLALQSGRRTQVVLQNRRKDGSQFANLLLLDHVGDQNTKMQFAVGTQFELSEADLDILNNVAPTIGDRAIDKVSDAALRIRLQRRRIASDSATRLLNSWMILNEMKRA